ncbi:MAG: glycoside hydrolase family 3 C-terminal domain-containing protein [Anaerolineales bacterium]
MSERIETLLQQLTLDEKIRLLAGADTWHTHAIPHLGIPALKVSDGPNGVRGTQKDTRSQTSASFPVGAAMGATWNPDLVHEIGQALAEEVRDKGAHVLLGPTVNLHRHPLAGRNFECFSEDPYHMSRMAVAYITGLQSRGVGACVKHFVCNDQEHERFRISAEVDERTLHEHYLPPFKAAVQEAGVWTLMTAYNRLNGTHASENRHLFDILKDEWGFDGLALSDWYGTYSDGVTTERLDLEMPGPGCWLSPEKVRDALRRGALTEAQIDDKVRRLLRTLERVGAFDRPASDEERSVDRPEHRALIRRAGQEAIVLLKNEGNLLPLEPGRVRRIAVIGRPAQDIAFQGGGSSEVHPHYVVQPLDAIQARCGASVTVAYAPGLSLHRLFPLLDPSGLQAEDGTPGVVTLRQYHGTDLAGEPFKVFHAGGTQLAWFGEQDPEFDLGNFSLTMSGTWTPPESGRYILSLATIGRGRLVFDGRTLCDWWDYTPAEQPQNFDGIISAPWREEHIKVDLEAGRAYPFRVAFAAVPGGRWRTVRFGALPPQPADPIGDAVAAAREADVALVFAGLTPEWESEGQDRESMDLPGAQNELIARVSAANPNTVVLLNAGSPLTMPWVDDVKAILQVWYLGQESGNAIADILFGDADPGGRLPTTFPKRL